MSEQISIAGARAQLIAAAQSPRLLEHPYPDAPDGARPSSVLMLFGRLDDIPAQSDELTVAADLDVLLQRRAANLASHPGQVSFPGGRHEPGDADAAATALREAQEETGLDPAGVEILATLPELPLAISNHVVTPVLAWWRRPTDVVAIDHAETVDVFRVPVAHLLDPANRFTSFIQRGNESFRGPAFTIDGKIVWGFTAILLDTLFTAAGWTIPWDASDERPVDF